MTMEKMKIENVKMQQIDNYLRHTKTAAFRLSLSLPLPLSLSITTMKEVLKWESLQQNESKQTSLISSSSINLGL